jgi:hypothetical protein
MPGDIFCNILGLSWLANPASKEKKRKIAGMGKRKEMGNNFLFMGKEISFKMVGSF